MLRALRFLALLALAIAAVLWLTDSPGTMIMEWRGYEIRTSAALMIFVVALLMGGAALFYRMWLFVRRAPGSIAAAWRERRRRRGYESLTRGMVAVAAGDPGEARKHAKRAEVLLNEPPLTMLLSAQAAQLDGDDTAAEGFFKAMAERRETEFLGLRGLLSQALKKGDRERALDLARRAYRLRPDSEWVSGTLFDLQAQSGLWLDASVTNDDLGRRRLIARDTADRRKGVLAYEQARKAQVDGDPAAEFKLLRQALDLAPDLVPAAVRLAHLLVIDGKDRRATGIVEKIWATAPHPDLVAEYVAARRAGDALQTVKAVERLTRANPDHPESHLALAQASADAALWGEARKHLQQVLDAGNAAEGYKGRALRLMAAVEDKETENPAAAREWLMRAATAGPDNAWVCSSCGNAAAEWTVSCGNCGEFDSYSWRTPPHAAPVAPVLGGDDAMARLSGPTEPGSGGA